MFDFDVRSGSDPHDREVLESDADPGRQGLVFDAYAGHTGPFLAEADLPNHHGDPLSAEIAHVLRRSPVVVAPACRLREAFKLMVDRHASAALVASHGVFLGMLTERDVVCRLLDSETPAAELPVWRVMAPEPETLLETDTVAYAVRKLWALGGRAMPILRANGSLFGLLETQDLVAWMCGRVVAESQPQCGRG